MGFIQGRSLICFTLLLLLTSIYAGDCFGDTVTITGPDAPVDGSQYMASGGTAPYTWCISKGSISQSGVVTVSGHCGTAMITVWDSCGNQGTKSVRMPVGTWVSNGPGSEIATGGYRCQGASYEGYIVSGITRTKITYCLSVVPDVIPAFTAPAPNSCGYWNGSGYPINGNYYMFNGIKGQPYANGGGSVENACYTPGEYISPNGANAYIYTKYGNCIPSTPCGNGYSWRTPYLNVNFWLVYWDNWLSINLSGMVDANGAPISLTPPVSYSYKAFHEEPQLWINASTCNETDSSSSCAPPTCNLTVNNFNSSSQTIKPGESVTFSGTLSMSADWTMTIGDRTFSGTGTPASATWDGKDSTGNYVGPGQHTATLTARNCNGSCTDSKTTNVEVLCNDLADISATTLTIDPSSGGHTEITGVATATSPLSACGLIIAGITIDCVGSSASLTWDGRDGSGKIVAPGIYPASFGFTTTSGCSASKSVDIKVIEGPKACSLKGPAN